MTEPSWRTFIQWKGTDLCMDFNCPNCGCHNHYDGYFAYCIECDGCGQKFKLETEIGFKAVEECEPIKPLAALDEKHDQILRDVAAFLEEKAARRGGDDLGVALGYAADVLRSWPNAR